MGFKKEVVDQTLHVLMGALLALPVAFVAPPHLTAVVGFISFVFREDAQHRPYEGWRWPIEGYGRWMDVAFGTLGSFAIGWV